MDWKRVILLILITLAFFFGVPKVSVATYYVAGDIGNDTYNTTQAQNTSTPWKTIQKATDVMVAGDTVNVKGGVTYTGDNSCSGNATVCIKNSGSIGSPIILPCMAGYGNVKWSNLGDIIPLWIVSSVGRAGDS